MYNAATLTQHMPLVSKLRTLRSTLRHTPSVQMLAFVHNWCVVQQQLQTPLNYALSKQATMCKRRLRKAARKAGIVVQPLPNGLLSIL